MAETTSIEWTDATWNPIGGCSIKSPGCIKCYAQGLAGTRLKTHPLYAGTTDLVKGKPVFNGKLTAAPADHPVWTWPLRWRGARNPRLGPGKPSLIFVGDMSDLFHEDRPDEVIDRVFAVMALCPQHIFQVLTKRADRMRAYLSMARAHPVGLAALEQTLVSMARNPRSSDVGRGIILQGDIAHLQTWPLPNVWLGVSAERQQEADERIPDLLATPAARRFVSYEPALGPVDFTRICLVPKKPGSIRAGIHLDALAGRFYESGLPYYDAYNNDGSHAEGAKATRLDWIIAGGESGKDGPRPPHPDWIRGVRDQCAPAGVPFFFKQWGEWIDADEWLALLEATGSAILHGGAAWKPSRPLNYVDAAILADLSDCPFQHWSSGHTSLRVGRKAAGARLDGREHRAFPSPNP